MPTTSTSQILGNHEIFEPYRSNIYSRRVLPSGFVVVSKHLLTDHIALNLWNGGMKNRLIQDNRSVQNIAEIPQHIIDSKFGKLTSMHFHAWKRGSKPRCHGLLVG